jgi:hypothetical protein
MGAERVNAGEVIALVLAGVRVLPFANDRQKIGSSLDADDLLLRCNPAPARTLRPRCIRRG